MTKQKTVKQYLSDIERQVRLIDGELTKKELSDPSFNEEYLKHLIDNFFNDFFEMMSSCQNISVDEFDLLNEIPYKTFEDYYDV